MPALNGDAVAGEQAAHDSDGLAETRDGPGEGDAVAALHGGAVADAEAEDEAPAGDGGHACGTHGGVGSGAGIDGQDAGAQAHPLRLHGDGGEGGERVASAALGGPDGLVTQALGQLSQLLQVLGGQRGVVLKSHSISGHGGSVLLDEFAGITGISTSHVVLKLKLQVCKDRTGGPF